jgi:hypothetical protein
VFLREERMGETPMLPGPEKQKRRQRLLAAVWFLN